MNRDKLFDHLEDLLVYARHLTRDREQAEDLIQDVVLHILSRDTCLSDVANPRAYMATTLRNLFLDQTRKEGRTPLMLPIGAVMSRISRARTKLRELI